MLDTLHFSGFNWIEFNIINGADRTGRAWYNSTFFQPFLWNLVDEMGPIAQKLGIDLLPVITSIDLPMNNKDIVKKYGFNDKTFQYPANWKDWVRAFGDRVPDPLRPEVQKFVTDLLVEVGQHCVSHPEVG